MATEHAILADPAALAAEALCRLQRGAAMAMLLRGRFAIALAGGSTPRALYRLLGDDPDRVDLGRTELFFGDERCVAPDHADSNHRLVQESWLERAATTVAPRLHRMRGEAASPEEAASAYEAELRATLGDGAPVPVLDLCLLGLGADGHCASLFPGTVALEERERLCVAVRTAAVTTPRLTLTIPCFAAAEALLFLVAGRDKAEILRRVLEPVSPEDRALPAARVLAAARKATILCDAAAAASLTPSPR